MSIESQPFFSRVPAAIASRVAPPVEAKPTGSQKAIEASLFAVFGLTIVLAGVVMYATNRPEHQRVPNHFAAGLAAGRVNVLLIGASYDPDGKTLTSDIRTESLMLLSVQPSTGRTALTSLPVDLWVKVGRSNRPLGSVYEFGEASGYPGGGTSLTMETIEKVIDQPVHGYARVDVGDLGRLVDTIGGLDVEAKRGVLEIDGDRHRFPRGLLRLDGKAAAHYAFAEDVAGMAADRFEREQRQREVALAALTKLLRSGGADLIAFNSLFSGVSATNLTGEQIRTLAGAARRGGEIRVVTLAPYLDTVDVTSVAYRGEAVQPRGGDFTTVRQLADAVLEAGVMQVR